MSIHLRGDNFKPIFEKKILSLFFPVVRHLLVAIKIQTEIISQQDCAEQARFLNTTDPATRPDSTALRAFVERHHFFRIDSEVFLARLARRMGRADHAGVVVNLL